MSDATPTGTPFPRRLPTPVPDESPGGETAGRDVLGDLLRAAGPRTPAPAERAMRVRAAVHDEWRDMLKTRLRHRRQVLGIGALLATAAAVILMTRGSLPGGVVSLPPPAAIVATLEAGAARLGGGAGGAVTETRGGVDGRDAGRPLASGAAIPAGSVIRTGPGMHAALRLGGGASLRLDERTTIVLDSDHELRLEAGALYADTGDALAASTHLPLRIQTPYGLVRDIGTRFELRLLAPGAPGTAGKAITSATAPAVIEAGIRVRVRDGAVRLDRGDQADTAQQGVEMTAAATGRASHRAIPLHGEEWAWVTRAAPPFNIEGATLARVLEWVERESGRHIRFAEAGLATTAATTIVHGSVEGLDPEEALGVVLVTSGLRYRLQGEDIVIASNQTP